MTDM
jgi:hypothetical protein